MCAKGKASDVFLGAISNMLSGFCGGLKSDDERREMQVASERLRQMRAVQG